MERDPLLLAWRHDRAGHLAVAGLMLLALPFALLVLDGPRQIAAGWAAGSLSDARVFDLLAVPRLGGWIRYWFGEALPHGLFGIRLDPEGQLWAAGLVVGALLIRLAMLAAVDRWRHRAAARFVSERAAQLAHKLTLARNLRDFEAREAVPGAYAALARLEPVLVGALTRPLYALGRFGLAVFYALLVDVRIGLAVLAAAFVQAGLALARIDRRIGNARLVDARRRAFGAAGTELVRLWPAIKAHGTGDAEAAHVQDRFRKAEAAFAGHVVEHSPGAAAELVVLLAPLACFALAYGLTRTADAAVGALIAAALLPWPADVLARWRRDRDAAAEDADTVGETLSALTIRSEVQRGAARPAGPADRAAPAAAPSATPSPEAPEPAAFATAAFAAWGATSPAVLPPLDISVPRGGLAAIWVPSPADADRLAAALAGLVPPQSGSLRVAGTDPARLDGEARAALVGFASAEPVLVRGSLGDNLAYGLPPDRHAALGDDDWRRALAMSGLSGLVEARALGASVDPQRHPGLAPRILKARTLVAERLAAGDFAGLVERFEPDRFNRYATLAENLLFGVPVGDTFEPRRLASHPFTRAVLEAQGLTKTLLDMGLSIAEAVTDLFADIPDGHPLFTRFAFVAPEDRAAIAEIVSRKGPRRRGAGAAFDQTRLLGLSLRYVETRHRLGLVDEALAARIVAARKTFRELIPANLRPSVDFYEPDAVCAAASFADNLLFGRIAFDLAGAERQVGQVVRDVIAAEDLAADIMRLGLKTTVAVDDAALIQPGVDLARCLLRGTPTLVVARPEAGLSGAETLARLGALRDRDGRLTVVVVGTDRETLAPLGDVIDLSAAHGFA